MAKKMVGIALARHDIFADGGRGKLIYPPDPSIARYRAVEAACFESMHDYRVFCTAGYSMLCPKKPSADRCVSLAAQQRRYVSEHCESGLNALMSEPLCWSTESEIACGIAWAQKDFVKQGDEVTLVIASHRAHLPRILIYCLKHLPQGWKLQVVAVRHRFSVLSWLLEPVKILRDVLPTSIALADRYFAEKFPLTDRRSDSAWFVD